MDNQNKIHDYKVIPPEAVWIRIAQELNELDKVKNLSRKLQHLEIAPPAATWEKIALELEAGSQSKKLSEKLSGVAIAPPAHIWDHITESLDEGAGYEKLSEKLNNAAIQPPATAWTRIAADLDDHSEYKKLAERLADMEVTPPLGNWSNIVAGLEEKPEEKKPAIIRKARFGWIRYAAAACLVGGLSILGIMQLMQQKAPDSNAFADNAAAPAATNGITAAPVSPTDGTIATDDDKTPATNGLLASIQQKASRIVTAAGNTYKTSVEKNKAIEGRYIVLMTEEGNVVRMSKKVSNLADCVAGESDSETCSHQIEQWQKELAKAPIVATPDNFLDLLELANSETVGL